MNDNFIIPLNGLAAGENRFSWHAGKEFFEVFENAEILDADLDVSVTVEKSGRYVGVDCEFSSSRHMPLQSCYLPGYADLGVTAEYITSRAISFWARGGNLLGMTIPRNLIYAFKGPYFTLGISLKL